MTPRPTGLKAYDKYTGRAVFEVILPGTGSRRRVRTVVQTASYADTLAQLAAFREHALTPKAPTTATEGEAGMPTFVRYVAMWWSLLAERLAPGTAAYETPIVEGPLTKFFGPFRLDKINSALLKDFAARLAKDGYAPSSRNRILSILRKLLRDAVAREILSAYPLRERLPRAKETPLQLELTNEERTKFLAAFENETNFKALVVSEAVKGKVVECSRFRAPRLFGGGLTDKGAGRYFTRFRLAKSLYIVALETGLRRGDLLELRWAAVHLDTEDGWIELVTTKTDTPVVIPLTTACRDALLDCKRRSIVSEFVFVTETGHPYSVTTVIRYFALAKRLAGITRRCRLHDLRHTFGSTWASAGISLKLIADVMGHASCRMTERYARVNRKALAKAAGTLDDQLQDQTGGGNRTRSPSQSGSH